MAAHLLVQRLGRRHRRGAGERVGEPSGFGHYLDALRANGEPPQDNPAVLAAAGDIACDPTDPNFNDGDGHDDADNTKDACMARRTSDVVVALNPSLVLPLGDDQYERGQLAAFDVSYDPTWGRFKSISRRSWATTSTATRRAARPATSTISAASPATAARAGTATTSAAGT